jgi:hypothetical protein
MTIEAWIDAKMRKIAGELGHLAQADPASFGCGCTLGYKHALLDLADFLETEGLMSDKSDG